MAGHDVFLSHNSEDRLAVEFIAEQLRARKLQVWLDKWEIPPGDRWQGKLNEGIKFSRAMAIFVGSSGLGPWQKPEMEAFLDRAMRGEALPVIPVLLPGAPPEAELPETLRLFAWVDMRGGVTDEELDLLVWGIKGERPVAKSASQARPVMLPLPLRLPPPDAVLPFLRIAFDRVGNREYSMEVEARINPGEEFLHERKEFNLPDTANLSALSEVLFNRGRTRDLLNKVHASCRDRQLPVRIQVIFNTAARSLDRINWESLTWKGLPLGVSSSYVFSRQFVFSAAEHGDLKIHPATKIDFSLVEILAQPEQDDQDRNWLLPGELSQTAKQHFQRSWTWESAAPSSMNYLEHELRVAEVAYLRIPIGVDPADPSNYQIALPEGEDDALLSTAPETISKIIRRLKEEKPAVMILAPLAADSGDQSIRALEDLAASIASAGTAAVIIPVGADWPPGSWDQSLQTILCELKEHGVIDRAVSMARASAPPGVQIRLYLRSKSGRLFYRPGMVAVKASGSSPEFDWERLRECFSGNDAGECVALIGPNFDPELNLSRRKIARDLARRHGFSLSRRDQEDLAKVADYIRVSQPGTTGISPHVAAFTEYTKDYLLKHQLAAESQHLSSRKVEEVAHYLGTKRLEEPDCPFDVLRQLSVRYFVTPSFHDILEQGLEKSGRQPVAETYRRQPRGTSAEQIAAFTADRPLVYHCFGTFARPEHMLLSETDYLDFFAAFCRADDPLTQVVRGILVDSSILVLGFSPNSWDFKLLFSAIRSMSGRFHARRHVHVAVQVDPEDDHTIDPDGARNFYRGLLSDLGEENVYLYWGRPTQFLQDLRRNVPEAFLGEKP